MRKDKGWTQDYLAELAGMSRSQLAMIEAETRPANTLRLNAIAAALGVSADELFDRDELEQALLSAARQLSKEDRETIVRMAEALAARTGEAKQ